MIAISLRRSGADLFVPRVAFRSLEALNNSSKRSRPMPQPLFGTSLGRSGECCRGEWEGGGVRRTALKLSESTGVAGDGEQDEKGEKGSTDGSSGGANEIEISGTGERATILGQD